MTAISRIGHARNKRVSVTERRWAGGGRIRLWRADCRVPPAPITQLAGDHRVPVRGGLPRRLWIVWPVESGGGLARQHRQVRNRNATRLASISFNLLPSPPPFSISDSIGHPHLPSPFPLSFPSPASPPGYLEFAKIHHRPIRLLQLDSSPPMQGSTHAANQRNMQPPYPPPPSGWQPASGSWMSGPIHHINTISTSQSFQVRDIENRMQLDPHRIAMERPQETLTSNLYFKILIINTVRYSGRLIHRSFESSTAGGGRGGVSVPASSAVSSADTRQQQSNKINGETSQFPRLAEYQGRYQFDPPPPPPLPPPPNCLYGRHYH